MTDRGLAPTTPSPSWSASAISQLRDATRCPLCSRRLRSGVCPDCGADLRGQAGIDVWNASSNAVTALTALQAAIAAVPRLVDSGSAARLGQQSATVVASGPVASFTPEAASAPSTAITVRAPRTNTTVQSVLAVAGAGLVALAALVFTFVNPDLTDPIARGSILVVAAVLFVAGAPVLMKRALRVSAECVATLALVFAVLATTVLSSAVGAVDPWALATAAGLVGGSVTLAFGLTTMMRSWMLAGSLALTLVPLLAGATLAAVPTSDSSPWLWGPLGTAAVAYLLLQAGSRLEVRRSISLVLERRALVVLQALAFVLLCAAVLAWPVEGPARWLGAALALLGGGAIAAYSAQHAVRNLWSFGAGASVPVSLVFAALALEPVAALLGLDGTTALAVVVPAAALAALILLAATAPARHPARRRSVLAGAMTVFVLMLVPHAGLAGLGAVAALVSGGRPGFTVLPADTGLAVVLGLMIASVGLVAYGQVLAHRAGRTTAATSVSRAAALWVISVAGIGALGLIDVAPSARSIAGIVLVAATASIVSGTALGRGASVAARLPIVLAAHGALFIAVTLSWQSLSLAVTLGAASLVALAALARTVPPVLRASHIAVGYSYALVLVATALGLVGVGGVAQLSVTATIGLLGAMLATFVRRIPAASWITVLIVATVPFTMAVALVVFERSGWVALSTTTMIALAVSLLVTRRPGLGIAVRMLAGAVVVPSVAVVFVTLGAELLVSSGSPVVLPAIALVCASVLPALTRLTGVLHRRGMPVRDSRAAAAAIESTTLLTASIAVGLAFAREAAGPPTALIVLLLLAVGSAAAAHARHVPPYWWVSGAAATGALWSLWMVLGVTALEAHLLPPALGTAVVAVVLTARSTPRPRLYGVAVMTAILTVVAVLATGQDQSPARVVSLVVAALLLVALGASIPSRIVGQRWAALRTPTLVAAIAAGLGACVQAARIGLRLDAVESTVATAVIVFGVAVLGTVPAALAGLMLTRGRSERRWSLVPAIGGLSISTWTAISPDPRSVTLLYLLMLVLLGLMVVSVAREQRGTTTLPRVWVLFALALVTAIVAWSPRELLRVDAFSLPLGFMLIAAGVVAMRATSANQSASLSHWPAGRTGSWALLAPGLVVLVLPSMLATATDPQTWRAVLVMGIALAAILTGVRWRLAAPFVLGIVVLPVENVLAFSVQIGRGIEAMPWWITLAVVGLVLLVIGVGSERRGAEGAAPTARLRDLR